MPGALRTEKFYNSRQNSSKNPHLLIDNIHQVLLLVELENGKVIGAYTQSPFSLVTPQSSHENIGFIFDLKNKKSFKSSSGVNSISYDPSGLVWGQ